MRVTQANPLAGYAEVYLDGHLLSHVVEADEEAHYVLVVFKDLSGNPVSQDGEPLTKKLEGRVEIRVHPGAPQGITRDLIARITELPKK